MSNKHQLKAEKPKEKSINKKAELDKLVDRANAQRKLCNRLIKAEKEKVLNIRFKKSGPAENWKIVNEIRKTREASDKLTITVDNVTTK